MCSTNMKKSILSVILSVIRMGANRKCLRLTTMRKIILSAILCGILVPATVLSQQQVLPAGLISMPVLIQMPSTDGTRFGTGLYMLASSNVFLVTAGHCIFTSLDPNDTTLLSSSMTLLSYGSDENTKLPNSIVISLPQYQREGRIKRHPTHDVAVVHVGNSESPFTNIAFYALSFHQSSATHTFPTDICTLLTKVPNGSETVILGYPQELLKPEATRLKSWAEAKEKADIDFDYPLVRRGIISQKNLTKGKLIIDSGVYGGNSGGPVLIATHPSMDVTDYKIIGIITKFVPVLTRPAPEIGETNSLPVYSGYSVVEPIDYAIELMQQFSTTNSTTQQTAPLPTQTNSPPASVPPKP